VSGDDGPLEELIRRLVNVSRRGLGQMYRADRRIFAHTLRRQTGGGTTLEGESVRYSAIVLLGAANLSDREQAEIFGGESALELADRLLGVADKISDLGDLALLTWAAAELGHPGLSDAVQRLLATYADAAACYTVELAWTLSALVAAAEHCDVREPIERIRGRLLEGFCDEAGVFPHVVGGAAERWYRSHVACFADQVYPIQALARGHAALAHERSLSAANRCAARICELQGEAGQWWWHYDARTGEVIEGYPVYSVHQDAMGPMALLDLAHAGGENFDAATRRGLSWMRRAEEVGHSLIDEEQMVIWRKVARGEPWKLLRAVRAAVSRVRKDLRLRLLDQLFRPTVVEYESRPYHLGWVLHTWLRRT
jgi:hypothetical protein